jgi:hypothetical protein
MVIGLAVFTDFVHPMGTLVLQGLADLYASCAGAMSAFSEIDNLKCSPRVLMKRLMQAR